MAWRMVIGGLLGGALLVTGCATKKFVQEEVAKSQQRTGAEVGRVDKSLGDEKARGRAAPEGARRDARGDRGRRPGKAAEAVDRGEPGGHTRRRGEREGHRRRPRRRTRPARPRRTPSPRRPTPTSA